VPDVINSSTVKSLELAMENIAHQNLAMTKFIAYHGVSIVYLIYQRIKYGRRGKTLVSVKNAMMIYNYTFLGPFL
tara:strand:- start:97 stop:321 length:225 start_codon:yes stop_codon:yes gene_type:complete